MCKATNERTIQSSSPAVAYERFPTSESVDQKKLTTEKLSKQIQLSIPETEDILHCRINKFTLDRLVSYVNNLFDFHLDIHEDLPKKTRSSAKVKSNVLFAHKTSNNRSKKYLK